MNLTLSYQFDGQLWACVSEAKPNITQYNQKSLNNLKTLCRGWIIGGNRRSSKAITGMSIPKSPVLSYFFWKASKCVIRVGYQKFGKKLMLEQIVLLFFYEIFFFVKIIVIVEREKTSHRRWISITNPMLKFKSLKTLKNCTF